MRVDFDRIEDRGGRSQPLLAIWLTWLIGPGSLGATFLFCTIRPEICDDPPNLLLPAALVATHIGALGVTVAMLLVQDRYRRVPEFWLLCAYWVAVAGFLLLLVLNEQPEPGLGRPLMIAMLAVAAVMPAAGLLRLWRRVVAGHSPGTDRS